MSIILLISDLEKTMQDLFNHPDFENTANDFIADAEDAEPLLEEAMTDKHALLSDLLATVFNIFANKIK